MITLQNNQEYNATVADINLKLVQNYKAIENKVDSLLSQARSLLTSLESSRVLLKETKDSLDSAAEQYGSLA